MNIGDWGLLLLLSALWGGSFFFSKVIVQEVPPFTLVLVRFATAAAALGAYLQIGGTPIPRSWPIWAALAGMGAFALVGLVLLLNRDWLAANGHESWLSICAAGVVWGIPGLLTMIVHDRHRKARRS